MPSSYLDRIGARATNNGRSHTGDGVPDGAQQQAKYWYEPGYVAEQATDGDGQPPEALLPSQWADFQLPTRPAPVWWRHNAFFLCRDGEEAAHEGKAKLLDASKVRSLREAADALNAGDVAEWREDFCVVRDAERRAYYVLHRFGKRPSALRNLGLEDPGLPGTNGEASISALSSGAQLVEVVVRHSTQHGVEVRLRVPRRSRFRHLKLALARHLDDEEVLRKGFFIKKEGVYTNHKDSSRVGDLRQVLVAGVDISSCARDGDERAVTVLHDGEVTTDDEAEPAEAVDASWMEHLERKLATVEERQGKARSSKLTFKDAISIQQELLKGFQDETFQQQLRSLQAASYSRTEFFRKRQELFLFVQSQVLPKYGFEGSQIGVLRMMGAMKPYTDVPQFASLAHEINALIGLEVPKERWKELSKDCGELAVADSQLAAGVTKSYISSRIA